MSVSYITRGDVLSALADQSATARGPGVVDRAIDSGSRAVESLCHRVFYPETDTRSLLRDSRGQHLWLDADEVLSASALTVDGTTIPVTEYTVWPDVGPTKPHLSLRFDSSRSFTRTTTITVTGEFGACADMVPAGATAEALDGVETDVDVTDGSLADVGDLLLVDSERMIVTGRTWITSAQTVQTPLTASAANTSVAVTTGSAFHAGEQILLDAERMLITDINSNTLIVKRASDGTVLATHTGSTVMVSRTLTVARGQLGTTAVTHLTAAPLTKLQAPALVRSMALAEAVNQVLQETGGYSATLGAGDNQRAQSGGGLDSIRARCYAAHGRKARIR